MEEVKIDQPVKKPECIEIPLEQAAQMLKLSPVYKSHHLPSILAMCDKFGYPKCGSLEDMKFVLQKYGYQILN